MAGIAQDDGSSSVSSSPLQIFSLMSISPGLGSPYAWLRKLKSEERGLCLIQLLLSCATHVATGSIDNANLCLDHISLLASPDGDSMQRVSAYFTEALAARALKVAWPGLYKALHATNLPQPLPHARRLFFDLCPFLKLAFLLANQAILEAMEGEKMIHVIDLNATEPAQWLAFLQALSLRPGGPPHVRITGVNDSKEVLDHTASRLAEEAERLDVPFQFNPVVATLESLDPDALRIKSGEALAVCSVLQLHALLAPPPRGCGDEASPLGVRRPRQQGTLGELLQKEQHHPFGQSPTTESSTTTSLYTQTRVEGLLAFLRAASPKIMVLVEQEASHNGATLVERVVEALHFYGALFDCLESTVGRASPERRRVEKHLFGEEIKDIVGCEGAERKERHERLERWVGRLEGCGLVRAPLSYVGVGQARRAVQAWGCEGYGVREEGGCVLMCWQDRPLFSVSSWRC
ncbi:hypothetical protein AMTRI_Chr01g131510 [Amborella trichopoda]|uniref:Uncharacterized protein n=1 Tax=Amborella trichopoda TaxID=13333 RepID=W1PDE0_AMBTC|nr:scarecrow-like protein 3 [Amborella trichopoda]ERN05080.1 hypothetical protein AMTR_s00053p00128820 [Amborella trichopoda]|eukprot:XP_006843405.1 scarecrow-like protein 3 [Amborella trichopoda]